ncbi:MAG: hypothetical protein ACP5GH_00575 [Nitrososphaeria archaeon]
MPQIRYDYITGVTHIQWDVTFPIKCPVCNGKANPVFSISRETASKASFLKIKKEKEEIENWDVLVAEHPQPLVDDKYTGEWNEWPYKSEPAKGKHYVVFIGKDHEPFHELSKDQVYEALYAIQETYKKLSDLNRVIYISIIMLSADGADMEGHPHFDVIGLPFVPKVINEEMNRFVKSLEDKDTCPICEVIKAEELGSKLIYRNENWIAYYPWSPSRKNEIRITSLTHYKPISKLTQKELQDLAFLLLTSAKALHEVSGTDYTIVFHLLPPKRSVTYYHNYIQLFNIKDITESMLNGLGIYIGNSDTEFKKIQNAYKNVLKNMVGL